MSNDIYIKTRTREELRSLFIVFPANSLCGIAFPALQEYISYTRGHNQADKAGVDRLSSAKMDRLRSYHLIVCLGSADRTVDSADRAVDSALAADLGLHLVHVDTSRTEEIADTVMGLFLGLLRRTHLLSRHALSASGWLGFVQPLCRGMHRCRGLVLGIVGISASARSLATCSLAFKMSVLYFDTQAVRIFSLSFIE
ncbi:hypothetical protein VIGAN_01187400 [Vigna angularis var. angularis]|uniref:Uncharacterized protein n=1 Tax=Vigna angularis var. angularis TaxID=157739 RepID=A0A0S3R0R7_PHAAN|nr:hypothetical protein VIGAN_01187400 [Vigna angularis var. angularis]